MNKFLVEEEISVITGGAGLIGKKHAEAVLEGEEYLYFWIFQYLLLRR